MNGIVSLILGVIFFGMVVLLCLFSCVLTTKSDEYWNKIRKEFRKK